MAFITFSDQWEVLIDDQGNPLHGRVTFLDYNTSQLKTVYQDVSNTIEAQNPQYTDATGKLINQIFLGSGMYKVKFERYIGSGDMMDPENAEDTMLWVTYKTEDVDGLASSESGGLGENVIVVNTIAELRTIDTDTYTTARVLGYYSRFDDIASRDYVWVSGDTRADNYGSIIQHTGQNTGRWNMLEPVEMDSRYFGVFPSNTETYNSNLAALLSWVDSDYSKNKTIRFSKGNYSFVQGSFQFNQNIIIEKDVTFDIIGSGELIFNIKNGYDIQTNNALIKTVDKLATVKIYFNGDADKIQNKKVLSSWYGEFNALSDSPTLIAIGERVLQYYDLYITGVYYHTSGTCNITNRNVYMQGTLYAAGGTYNFTNCDIKNLRLGVTSMNYYNTASRMENFQFNNSVIRSSLFGTTGFQTILRCQVNSTQSRFIFDSSVTFSGSFTDNGIFLFEHEHGTINTQTTEAYAIFNTFKLPERQVFIGNSWVGLKNQDTKLCYFMPDNPTQNDEEIAFYNMIRCALHGNGVADICNLDPEINAVSTDKRIISEDNVEVFILKNGAVTVSSAITLLNIYTSISNVKLQDFYMNDTSSGGSTLVACAEGGSITNLIFDNVTIVNVNGVGEAVRTTNGGLISNFDIQHSNIRNAWLINETIVNDYGIRAVNIHNNKNLQCGFRARNAKPVINGNYIQGNIFTSFWEVKANYSAVITGNRFFQCDLYLLDNSGGIDHVVTGNHFESTDEKWSRVIVKAETANTKVVGLTIVGNSFTGVLNNSAASPTMIYCEGSYSPDVAYIESGSIRSIFQSVHKCTVKDNTAQDFNMILPTTEGIAYLNSLGDSAAGAVGTRVNADGYLRYVWKLNLRPEMFYIPGSTYAIHGNVIVETAANLNGTTDSTNQHWYDPKGIDKGYRNDGKFVFSMHMTSDKTQYANYLAFNFKIYDKVLVYTSI